MPRFMCRISTCPGLPASQRFWDMVRIDAKPRTIPLDLDQKKEALILDLQKQGIIGKNAKLKSYTLEKIDDNLLLLVYVSTKKPTSLLQIQLPADRQQELF